MNGFHVYSKNNYEKSFQNRAGYFNLLAQDENLEVFESVVNPGKSIICQPYESLNSMNVIIVLSGKMFHTNNRRFINAGDRIKFKNLNETHHISVIEKSKLLVVRSSLHFVNQASTTDTVYDLVHQIQERDQYTEEHCNETGNLATQIATILKLPEKKIENLLHASKIHDVGKINIPNEILNKPSRLTYDEFELIKQHAKDGHDIILRITGFSDIAKIVLEHHERLDGSGYPNGLVGEQIPIESRILAVVDSFDAMVSDRPYKSPHTVKEALDDLNKHVGSWYDKQVVEALEEVMEYIGVFYERTT